ncbi:MAG: PEP-CTERM sorting domain-containing protein [Akkermansiaceae bacterium]|nr:PEP-CTERM sorting domain-containing protein [Akkermansiaceae bacterium]
MKKTIITLLALGSLATAADTELVLSKAGSGVSADASFSLEGLTISHISATPSVVTGNNTFDSTAYTNSLQTFTTNVGSGGAWSYTLSFEVSNVQLGYTVDSIAIDFFTHSGGGQAQNNERDFNLQISLTMPDSQVVSLRDKSSFSVPATQVGNGKYTDGAYGADGELFGSYQTLPLESLALTEGKYTLKIDVSQNTNSGTFVALGNVTLSTGTIPEPTSATLSWLALVGLVWRRRRP